MGKITSFPLTFQASARPLVLFLALALVATAGLAQVTTAFTYQGELEQSGQPASGNFDFEFVLFDVASGGTPLIGPINVEDVPVDAGLFTTEVDFGMNVFGVMDVWLEIRVREGASTDAFTTLAPRQKVTPAPLAHHALNVEMDAIGTAAIAPGGVSESDIADSAISSRTLATGSVGSSEVSDNSLTATDLAADSVGSQHCHNSADRSELKTSHRVRVGRLA